MKRLINALHLIITVLLCSISNFVISILTIMYDVELMKEQEINGLERLLVVSFIAAVLMVGLMIIIISLFNRKEKR